MAKPKTNLIIEESKFRPNLLRVWTPTPAAAKEPITAIEGVVRVFHSTQEGCLNVWINPCYDQAEITAEIELVISGIVKYY